MEQTEPIERVATRVLVQLRCARHVTCSTLFSCFLLLWLLSCSAAGFQGRGARIKCFFSPPPPTHTEFTKSCNVTFCARPMTRAARHQKERERERNSRSSLKIRPGNPSQPDKNGSTLTARTQIGCLGLAFFQACVRVCVCMYQLNSTQLSQERAVSRLYSRSCLHLPHPF